MSLSFRSRKEAQEYKERMAREGEEIEITKETTKNGTLYNTRTVRGGIKRIERVELSDGYAEITKLGKTYNFNHWENGEPYIETNLSLEQAKKRLADAIRRDLLEIG